MALRKFNHSNTSSGISSSILKDLLTNLQTPATRSGILVKEGNDFVQIKMNELLYIYSEDSVTFGVTEKRRYIISETVDQLFGSLDSTEFYQINRGQIVSKTAILRFSPYFNSRVKLQVSNPRDQEFVVSRQKTSDFKAWMNQ
jgi:DNA-binding LytR/AlgR family response regulator